jgi:putative ABC transport system ATP-binding protein
LIELRQVVKSYESLGGALTALNGISLKVRSSEFLVITGKSGSGKTTLVNMSTGLDRPTSGEIWVDGVAVNHLSPDQTAQWRGRTLGVIFQSFELLPTLTVLQNVMLPMDFASRYPVKEQRQRALHLLGQVDIVDHALKLPSALSGGQQQRVAIARALANDPAILVADEPTGSLDAGTAKAVIDLFEDLARQGRTILLVTHDEDIAKRGARVITLLDGQSVDEKGGAHVSSALA